MRSTSYPKPLIFPAIRSDIPTLVNIWLSAKEPDLLYQLQWRASSKEKLKQRFTDALDSIFDDPEWMIMKAVDVMADEITAVAVWEKSGFSVRESVGGGGRIRVSGGLLLDNYALDEKPLPINEYIGQQWDKFSELWTKGIKHIGLQLLMTDPRFQRRGIGTALMKWGHELADREAVPCFLSASPFGYPLYKSLGWNDVGEPLVLDLKEWVQYAQGGDMGWGVYKMYYMLRLPRTNV